jgi:hypothetical protein
VLAYVFWHRPQPDVEVGPYEQAQRDFHGTIESPSACFRLDELPFEPGGPGYEDWYLVADWAELGALNEAAVDAVHRPAHDEAAAGTGAGWGAVYSLANGPAAIPDSVEWRRKPMGESSEAYLAGLPETTVWRRELVLGPAPEYCVAVPGPTARERIWPTA